MSASLLHHSDKKLGCATLYVYISLVPSETITNYSLLITNCIFAPSDKKFGQAACGVSRDISSDKLHSKELSRLGNIVYYYTP